MSELNEYMKNNKSANHAWLTRRVELKSGLSISIQASESHYCEPRKNLDPDRYTSFELGFPSEKVEDIIPFAQDHSEPTETVYGYVPREVVEKIIADNGGIKGAFVRGES